MPEQREDDAGRNCATEDIRPTPTPARLRVVGDVAHQRVGQGVSQAWQRTEQSDECRVHSQTEVEDDYHAADCRGEQVIDERAETVDQLLVKRNAIRWGRFVMRSLAHAVDSDPAMGLLL